MDKNKILLIKRPTIVVLFLSLVTIFSSFLIVNDNSKEDFNLTKESNLSKGSKNFLIYDGILYKKPDLGKYGLRKINVIYEDSLLDKGKINYTKLDNEIQKAKKNSDLICLDIESWDLRDEKYKENGKKYIYILNYFKQRLPGRKIGYYGMLPYRDAYLYNQRSGANSIKRINYVDQWEKMNNNLNFITQAQDIAFPSFYTRNKSMELWTWVTQKQIAKLKAINPDIPVYGFIWPQYWNKEFISGSDWAYQLEVLYKICDGVVIWNPPFNIDDRKTIQWDSQREWWKETLKFIKRHNIS
ncbi:hypothetical protein [Sphingobacterium sp.]|uniref:hypothetical protein n=1 Tax=Sphingobacterium sp. TaxID=341027 RepID=UPI002586E737|nr:hypothetical protein [Sphingobacterium sp.]WET70813.1 MAG: hypothetical protein P0Y57_06945 [Sphingobacterium sp.]